MSGGHDEATARSEATESSPDDDEARELYRELLEELRTIIPGVQVLFGFLLTVPFNSRFTELDDVGVRVFTVALVSVGLATVVLVTPAAYHRIVHPHDRHRLAIGTRTTLAGLAFLALSVGAALFVVIRLIFTTESLPLLEAASATTVGAAVAALVGGGAVALWFALPVVAIRRRRHRRHG